MDPEKLNIVVGTPGETQDQRVVSSGPKVNLHLYEVERHRVTCPYCIVNNGGIGYSLIKITRKAGAAQYTGLADPHKCNFCKKWFRVKCTMSLTGVPFNSAAEFGDNQRNKELTNGG